MEFDNTDDSPQYRLIIILQMITNQTWGLQKKIVIQLTSNPQSCSQFLKFFFHLLPLQFSQPISNFQNIWVTYSSAMVLNVKKVGFLKKKSKIKTLRLYDYDR